MNRYDELSILRGRMTEAIARSDYSTPEKKKESIIKIKNCVNALLCAGEQRDAIVSAQQAIALEFEQ